VVLDTLAPVSGATIELYVSGARPFPPALERRITAAVAARAERATP
jgi:hypothetical protein